MGCESSIVVAERSGDKLFLVRVSSSVATCILFCSAGVFVSNLGFDSVDTSIAIMVCDYGFMPTAEQWT